VNTSAIATATATAPSALTEAFEPARPNSGKRAPSTIVWVRGASAPNSQRLPIHKTTPLTIVFTRIATITSWAPR
jgi:hypothetical protein